MVAYILVGKPSCLSLLWSCISTRVTVVPATQVSPVPVTDGSAVFDSHLTSPVRVVPDTQVNLIHSFTLPDLRKSRHLVTVGAVATVIVVSAAASFAASVVTKPDSRV